MSRETTWITEPLRRDGTPDYAKWLTRTYGGGVTPGNNAAALVGALAMIGRVSDSVQLRRALREPWDEHDAPLVADWLHVHEATVARAAEIVRSRPRFWIAPTGDMGMDTRIPSRGGMGDIANAIRARALRHLRGGRGDAARGDLVLGLRFGALLDQGPWLIDRVIGGAVRRIAAEPVVALANPPAARRAEGALLLAGLRAIPASAPLDDVFDAGERIRLLAEYLDLYRAARRSSEAWRERSSAVLGMLNAFSVPLGQKAPPPNLALIPGWAIDWNELFRIVNACWLNPDCDSGMAAAAADLESRGFDRLVEEARTSRDARRRIARAFLTLERPLDPRNPRRNWNEQQAVTRMGLVSSAAALWQVDHGRYPAGADSLAAGPSSAGFDPAAEHAGYAFRYSVAGDGRRFAYTATPLRPAADAMQAFCADSSGRLASSAKGAGASVVDGLCARSLTTLVARTADP